MPVCQGIAPTTGNRCKKRVRAGQTHCSTHRNQILVVPGVAGGGNRCEAMTGRGIQCSRNKSERFEGTQYCTFHHNRNREVAEPEAEPEAGGAMGALTMNQIQDLCFLMSEGFGTQDIMVILGIPPTAREPARVVSARLPPRPRQERRRATRRRTQETENRELKPEHIAVLTVPATAEQIKEKSCPVCLEEGAEMTEPVKLDCGHITCKDCIVDWSCTNKHNSCPLCRTPLLA